MSMPFAFNCFAPGKAAFDFWISFFPTAPLFGVRWRFDDMMPPGMMEAWMMAPGMNPFAMPASPFYMPGAAAPARPGELDTPACVPDVAAQPVTETAEVAGETVSEMTRVAAETGRAAVRAAGTAVQGAAAMEMPATGGAAEVSATADEPTDAAPRPAGTETDGRSEAAGEAPAGTQAPAAAAARKPKMLLSERPGDADDLKVLNGIGAGLERQLNELGVYRFDQIAGMSESDLAWIDENLMAFRGRCFRDDWVGQAKARLAR